MRSDDVVSTDTYFGMFPCKLWREKAGIDSFSLVLDGEGRIAIRVTSLVSNQESGVVLRDLKLALEGRTCVDLSELSDIAIEACYLEIKALGVATLRSVYFATSELPRRRVEIGLVITTFGRADLIKETLTKISRFIATDPEVEYGAFQLIIVDNGRDLDAEASPVTIVIPNANLGGAGGFARGLDYLTDQTQASHACFMDDDASTDDECLLRARRLLAFALDERTAISGAMLRSETSFMMHEQGAVIEWGRRHRIISRKHGLDLRKRTSLVEILRPETVGYGGWWLFCFPIRGELRFPYPMFVRGDDWLFSYLNTFVIETWPGLCSWQEGFENKISPVEQYLAFKAFLVAEIMLRQPESRISTCLFFVRWIFRNLYGYCYDRAELNCEAFSDVLKGPEFWKQNAALAPRLREIRGLVRSEVSRPLSANEIALPLVKFEGRERRICATLRLLTLNGHLVPHAVARFVTRDIMAVRQIEAPKPILAFLRRTVIYKSVDAEQGFRASRDAKRFLLISWRAIRLAVGLCSTYSRLRASYLTSIGHTCTAAWWRGQFKRVDP